jgi:hypothetical protein
VRINDSSAVLERSMAVAGELYNHASEVDKAIYKFYITRSEVGLPSYDLFKLLERFLVAFSGPGWDVSIMAFVPVGAYSTEIRTRSALPGAIALTSCNEMASESS